MRAAFSVVASYRKLHHDGVAHEDGGDERRVSLVEGVVERSEVEHHTEGRAANLRKSIQIP